MRNQSPLALAALAAAFALFWATVPQGRAQREVVILSPQEARSQLESALEAGSEAEARAARFTDEAQAASEAADRAAREAAALAARIQQIEAQITAARARYSLAQVERARLANQLANRQQPLVQLTAALQTTARRPLALSALQPGSLKDLVYVRAVLDSAVPQIRARTATLRSELEEGRKLERRARRALTQLRDGEKDLKLRRTQLAALEAESRAALSAARGNAAREEDRALALAEEARDLDGLIERLDENARLRRALAALPGPVLRPQDPSAASPSAASDVALAPQIEGGTNSAPNPAAALASFQLPVQGRTILGFGEQRASGLRSKGLSLSPAAGAQIVAPAPGRVVFSGPYEGFGRIVIIEHAAGLASLVTGLARIDVEVGQSVIGGAPLGVADEDGSPIGIELRDGGDPVNPLDYLE